MNKIICAPESHIPEKLASDTMYFCEYAVPKSHNAEVGHFGTELRNEMKKRGIIPSIPAWDFLTIALSVASADNYLPRKKCFDGWTRNFDIEIYLIDPNPWIEVKKKLQDTLRFLTGDYWKITFHQGGELPEKPKKKSEFNVDCVSLLSGGLDSLVGAVDLAASGHKPAFVSQNTISAIQQEFARKVAKESPHFQWTHAIHPKDIEPSTRARSIVFFAFASIVASFWGNQVNPFDISVPENGFISLNIPLNPGRMGSYSTKTTHPVFMRGLQEIWNQVGIHARLNLPYKFKTKGELLAECKNRTLIEELAATSVSCGRFGRYGRKHCGRCVPCMVRRAAFINAGINDPTEYVKDDLSQSKSRPNTGADDIGAMAAACVQIEQDGIESLIQGNLFFAFDQEFMEYKQVVERGFLEVRQLLEKYRIL